MQTYTQGGYSPQQQQLNAGQPNSVNSMPPPGSPSSAYGSDEALNSRYAAANESMMTANSPDTRQQLVSNSNIPAMSQNYDDLAKQLFEYDQGTLAPKFQGTNPGLPSDAASFGRVEASPLAMTIQGAGLPASQGLSTATGNPKYAYSSQIDQGSSILSLLDKLIGGINSGMTDVKGKNASNVAQAQSAIDTVYKIMGLKEDARQKELDRMERAADRAASRGKTGSVEDAEVHAEADAKKGVTFTDLSLRYGSTVPLYKIREIYNNANYYKKAATESESDILKIVQEGKKPGALSAERMKLSSNTKSALSDLNRLKGMTNEGQLALAELPGGLGARDYLATRNNIMDTIARLRTGAQMSKNEEETYKNFLPRLGDDKKTINNKISRLENYFNSFSGGKEVLGTDPTAYDINSGKTVMIAPNGKKYTVDNKEITDAKKNGWRVQ
jgi:hypothetical protein